jgi:peptidoglycan/LPS O-acetylase OafA/YrhL
VLSVKLLTLLGTVSYSVYLWQQPLYQLSFGHHKLYGLGLLLISIGIGAASFAFVEQPARKGLNRLADRVARRRVAATGPSVSKTAAGADG